jgi:hypothetical protein
MENYLSEIRGMWDNFIYTGIFLAAGLAIIVVSLLNPFLLPGSANPTTLGAKGGTP